MGRKPPIHKGADCQTPLEIILFLPQLVQSLCEKGVLDSLFGVKSWQNVLNVL